MSFIAGSVAGDIILGIEGFTGPLLQAEHLAEAFPEVVEGSLSTPLRELSELASSLGSSLVGPFQQIDSSAAQSGAAAQAAGEQISGGMKHGAAGAREAGHASEEMGHSILRSMVEAHAAMEFFPDWVVAFWADPLLGVATLARETGDALVEAFNHVADDAEDMNLAAEKLGVSVEFFSKWSAVAKSVRVDADSLRNGMYMLNRIVGEELANPTKELTAAFNDLGISTAWLNAHVGNSEAIFTRVQSALGAMTNAQTRSFVVQELMNRGAQDLVPLFVMQRDQIDQLSEAQRNFGDVTDEAEAKAGAGFQEIKTEFWMMVEGLEKAAAVKPLEFITAHKDQIEKDLTHISAWGITEIGKFDTYVEGIKWGPIFEELKTDVNNLIGVLPGASSGFKSLWDDAKGFADEIVRLAGLLSGLQKHPTQHIKTETPFLDEIFAHRYEENDARNAPPPPKRRPLPDAEGIDWGADFKTRQKPIDDAWKAEGARESASAAAAEPGHRIEVQVKVNIESAMVAAEKVADVVRAAVHQAMQKNLANQASLKSSGAIGGQ